MKHREVGIAHIFLLVVAVAMMGIAGYLYSQTPEGEEFYADLRRRIEGAPPLRETPEEYLKTDVGRDDWPNSTYKSEKGSPNYDINFTLPDGWAIIQNDFEGIYDNEGEISLIAQTIEIEKGAYTFKLYNTALGSGGIICIYPDTSDQFSGGPDFEFFDDHVNLAAPFGQNEVYRRNKTIHFAEHDPNYRVCYESRINYQDNKIVYSGHLDLFEDEAISSVVSYYTPDDPDPAMIDELDQIFSSIVITKK